MQRHCYHLHLLSRWPVPLHHQHLRVVQHRGQLLYVYLLRSQPLRHLQRQLCHLLRLCRDLHLVSLWPGSLPRQHMRHLQHCGLLHLGGRRSDDVQPVQRSLCDVLSLCDLVHLVSEWTVPVADQHVWSVRHSERVLHLLECGSQPMRCLQLELRDLLRYSNPLPDLLLWLQSPTRQHLQHCVFARRWILLVHLWRSVCVWTV
jgi:hypothetical protein